MQPCLGDQQLEQNLIVRRRRRESIIQGDASLVRLVVNELAAHPVLGSQITDRPRSRQGPNGQVLTVALGQPRRRPATLVHIRTTTEKIRVPSSPRQRQSGPWCNPSLNHARSGDTVVILPPLTSVPATSPWLVCRRGIEFEPQP